MLTQNVKNFTYLAINSSLLNLGITTEINLLFFLH